MEGAEVKNWKETAKDRRTWTDLAEKAKTHKGLQCQMMMMMMIVEGVAYSDLVMTEEHKEKSVPALFVSSKIPGIVLGLTLREASDQQDTEKCDQVGNI